MNTSGPSSSPLRTPHRCDFSSRPPTDALRVISENHRGPLHLHPFWGCPPSFLFLGVESPADSMGQGSTGFLALHPHILSPAPWPFLWLHFRSKQEKECAECFPPFALTGLHSSSHMSSKGGPSAAQGGVEWQGPASLHLSRFSPFFLLPCPLPRRRDWEQLTGRGQSDRKSDLMLLDRTRKVHFLSCCWQSASRLPGPTSGPGSAQLWICTPHLLPVSPVRSLPALSSWCPGTRPVLRAKTTF